MKVAYSVSYLMQVSKQVFESHKLDVTNFELKHFAKEKSYNELSRFARFFTLSPEPLFESFYYRMLKHDVHTAERYVETFHNLKVMDPVYLNKDDIHFLGLDKRK